MPFNIMETDLLSIQKTEDRTLLKQNMANVDFSNKAGSCYGIQGQCVTVYIQNSSY